MRWLDERSAAGSVREFLRRKTVPRHKHTVWYYFGGLTLFFFVIQIISGVLLAFYYRPTPELAHESVQRIITEIPHGWIIRSIHAWSANLMVLCLLVHMFSVFLLKSYRKPRELLWLSGVLLMLLVFGFCFTGYLLPWDTTAYFATLIGTEVPKTLPIIGDWGVSLLKGEEEVGAETLSRMFIIHIVVLPLSTLFLVACHILLTQIHGPSTPIGIESTKPPIPFMPNFMLRDGIAWGLGSMLLLTLVMVKPPGIGEPADPYASAPPGIKPEWYFLPLYQSLRMVPATVAGISGELVVNLLVGLLGLAWFAVPFIDKDQRAIRSRLVQISGIFLMAYIVVTIILAYTT